MTLSRPSCNTAVAWHSSQHVRVASTAPAARRAAAVAAEQWEKREARSEKRRSSRYHIQGAFKCREGDQPGSAGIRCLPRAEQPSARRRATQQCPELQHWAASADTTDSQWLLFARHCRAEAAYEVTAVPAGSSEFGLGAGGGVAAAAVVCRGCNQDGGPWIAAGVGAASYRCPHSVACRAVATPPVYSSQLRKWVRTSWVARSTATVMRRWRGCSCTRRTCLQQ